MLRRLTFPISRRAVALALVAASIILPFITKPARSAEPPARAQTLIVFENNSTYQVFSESNAVMTANLVGHFDRWTAVNADEYTANLADSFASIIYVGSTYRSTPLPTPFLDDVLEADADSVPVLWMGNNIWDLTWRQDATATSFQTRFGFTWSEFSTTEVFRTVMYRSKSLTREAAEFGVPLLLTSATTAEVLATATGPGVSTPWALRSGTFRYITEVPYAYVSETDRYLILTDLLFDHFGVAADRHRAIIRLEDISAASNPADIVASVDVLKARNIPFGIHVIPFYVDPDLARNGANPIRMGISEQPTVVAAIQYALANGGELIMHGSTHQSGNLTNPYDGVSGSDFEFFRAHVDESDDVILDGEIAGLDPASIDTLLDQGLSEISRAGLPRPNLWTTPHYASTPAGYASVGSRFSARLERGMYFNGTLTNEVRLLDKPFGQFFPYAVRDVYNQVVLPENLGNQTTPYNQHPGRTPADLVNHAVAASVVRDGFASSFWHPYLAGSPQGLIDLATIVDGVRSAGFTYVRPSSAISDPVGGPASAPPPPPPSTTTTSSSTTSSSTTSSSTTTSTTTTPTTTTTTTPTTTTTTTPTTTTPTTTTTTNTTTPTSTTDPTPSSTTSTTTTPPGARRPAPPSVEGESGIGRFPDSLFPPTPEAIPESPIVAVRVPDQVSEPSEPVPTPSSVEPQTAPSVPLSVTAVPLNGNAPPPVVSSPPREDHQIPSVTRPPDRLALTSPKPNPKAKPRPKTTVRKQGKPASTTTKRRPTITKSGFKAKEQSSARR
jgi:uncharacterized protein YdaL